GPRRCGLTNLVVGHSVKVGERIGLHLLQHAAKTGAMSANSPRKSAGSESQIGIHILKGRVRTTTLRDACDCRLLLMPSLMEICLDLLGFTHGFRLRGVAIEKRQDRSRLAARAPARIVHEHPDSPEDNHG